MSGSEERPILLRAEGLRREFTASTRSGSTRGRVVRAVDGVDLEVRAGESFALVGESGSGKTTLARLLLRLIEPTAGRVVLEGVELTALGGPALRRARRDFQMVFQDAGGSLDPRQRVGRALAEPLRVHGLETPSGVEARVRQLLGMVGLSEDVAERFPGSLSGGQRQRVALARALATGPRLLVADEPVSSLDVSIRGQVINLLARLQRELDLTLLFIGHDLATVEQLADRVAVMYLGRLVELAPTADLFATPLHPYSVALLSAIPVPDPGRHRPHRVRVGEPPDPTAPPPGCRFHPRCPLASRRCRREEPQLREIVGGHLVACHHPGELAWSGLSASTPDRDNLSPTDA